MSCPGNISENPGKIASLDFLLPKIRPLQQDQMLRYDHLRSLKQTLPIEKTAVYILMEPCSQKNDVNNRLGLSSSLLLENFHFTQAFIGAGS